MAERLNKRASWFAVHSLRTQIGATMALLVFIVAGLIGGLVGHISELQARAQIGQSLAVDAQRLGERLETEMAARQRELSLLASIDALRELATTAAPAPGIGLAPALAPSLARAQALLDELKRSEPSYAWLGIASPSGYVLAATDPTSIGSTIAMRDTQRPPVPLQAGENGDDRVIDLLQPIRDVDSNVVGVIAAKMPWSAMRRLERAVVSPDSDGVLRRETFLVGPQESVLLGPPGMVGRILPLAVTARARAGFYGWAVEPWPADDGRGTTNYLTGAAYVAGGGKVAGLGAQSLRWAVLVREAEDAAFAPATQLRETIWLVGAIIAASFALAGWLVAGMATRPLAGIALAAERLRQGDDVEIPRRRAPAEIDSLAASLRALVATLTRKQMALNEMEELALHDPLTGLLNRHGLRANLAVLVGSAKQRRMSLMVFIGDLDGFKGVNDTLGHAAGDQLLCQVARRLKQSVRDDDLVARVGGDEFVLAMLAPGGPQDEGTLAVVRRVQAAVMAPYRIGGHDLNLGCSLGGACWPDHIQSSGNESALATELEQVLQLADIELYLVKRSGKGRVQLRGAMPSLTV